MPMAPPPPSSASSCSAKSVSQSPLHRYLHHSPKSTPIRGTEELEDEIRSTSTPTPVHHHHPTPLHRSARKQSSEKVSSSTTGDDEGGVSCMKCRPSPREKISVVPIDNSNNSGSNKHSLTSSMASPNLIFKAICSSLTRKSPKGTETPSYADAREEQWRIALTELSQKLVQTTRKRDEAALEASRLKHSMADLEKKLNKLEIYCHSLKSNLDLCNNNNKIESIRQLNNQVDNQADQIHQEKVVQSFLQAISDARSNVRVLSKALTLQLRQTGGNINEKISSLLQPYDVKLSTLTRNPRGFLFYLESLLNRAFFEDFESSGFEKNSPNFILNPLDRCESNYASFTILKNLTWEEVLNKGTKHFSECFSRFCDRKMSEVVTMLGWNRAWPEPLLQAFFGASKSVWLVHLLANSVHPSLPIFRIDPNSRFDSVYMADMGADRARKLVPSVVRVMVAPGFYVFGNVVKCKVLCRYVAELTQEVNLNRSD
ncbi:hypothetical protein QQ045_019095 [Rhodiola kirilowii]